MPRCATAGSSGRGRCAARCTSSAPQDAGWLDRPAGTDLRRARTAAAPGARSRRRAVRARARRQLRESSRPRGRRRAPRCGAAADRREGQAPAHLLVAALRGVICRAPPPREPRAPIYVLLEDGPGRRLRSSDEALTRLARRYLAGHAAGDGAGSRGLVGDRAAARPARAGELRETDRPALVDGARAAPPGPMSRCSATSIPTCSATRRATSCSTLATRGASRPAAASSRRRRSSTAASRAPGGGPTHDWLEPFEPLAEDVRAALEPSAPTWSAFSARVSVASLCEHLFVTSNRAERAGRSCVGPRQAAGDRRLGC